MEYKYPYIPADYYPAVMGACSYIRETGYFNKAVKYYARKYRLNEKTLAEHIRKRQAAGQRNSEAKRQYHYYVLEYSLGNERLNGCLCFEPTLAVCRVLKATSELNAMKQARNQEGCDYGDEYGYECFFSGRWRECDTKREAEDIARLWTIERSNNAEET